ncbi:DUF418 domain-containing protein [Sphingomonas sp. 3-13AW]|uniref:DUF418 domain-containing protein n=1 Tax=Sphingomonas sp. 3-13AW TaxID=3050450 RepID=UPI003BB7F962
MQSNGTDARRIGGLGAAELWITPGPARPEDRLVSLDVLRGFALLGILVLNVETFAGPSSLHDIPMGTGHVAFVGWHAPLDYLILSIKWMFFEGKMRTLFAMLFGAGAVLLTQRLEQGAQPERAADIFCRRNLWLLLFGLIHGTLIWMGDILFNYALLALLFLFPLRRVATRKLILLGLIVGIVGGGIGLVRRIDVPTILRQETLVGEARAAIAAHRTPTPAQRQALAAQAKEDAGAAKSIAEEVQAGRSPFLESIAPRADMFLKVQFALFTSGMVLEVVGSMMLGMGLYKSGFFTCALPRRRYVEIAALGYAVTIPIVVTGLVQAAAGGFSQAAAVRWLFLPYTFEIIPGAVANAAVLLLVIRQGWLRPVTGALANVGRTALSNYVLTSILCQFLFAWGPWKLFGVLEYYQQLYAVAGVWAINLIASALWLRAFRYGPLEWVWRSLVYWKRQPMLRRRLATEPGWSLA